MISRSFRYCGGKLFIHIFVFFHFYAVTSGSLYDCITSDGKVGVCVSPRMCRNAIQDQLSPCQTSNGEGQCCPVPTALRSAQSPAEKPGFEPEDEKRPPVRGGGTSNKTPPPGGKRSPTRRNTSDRPSNGPDEGRQNTRRHEKPNDTPPNRPGDRKPQHTTKPPGDESWRDTRYPGSDTDIRDFKRPVSPPPRRRQPEIDRDPPPRNPGNPRASTETPMRFTSRPTEKPLVPACGVKPYELFIAGGEESREHEWPWMAAIFRRYENKANTFYCGGSLINTRFVLTAAHCFVNNYVKLPPSSFIVRLGSHFLDSGEDYTVSHLELHSNHSGSEFFNDIALVRLASQVFVTDKIAPICLPSPDMMNNNFVGRQATVAGWGDAEYRSGHSRALQHVTIPIVRGEECSTAYSRVKGAGFLAKGSEHIVCAGLREGGKDACLGDSGGPLMIKMSDDRYIIVGIVSLGYKCAEPGFPGVYTRVTHYMSWIYSHMNKL